MCFYRFFPYGHTKFFLKCNFQDFSFPFSSFGWRHFSSCPPIFSLSTRAAQLANTFGSGHAPIRFCLHVSKGIFYVQFRVFQHFSSVLFFFLLGLAWLGLVWFGLVHRTFEAGGESSPILCAGNVALG